MKTIKILISKELHTCFNSWNIYIGYILFSSICGIVCWLASSNIFTIGQATMEPIYTTISWILFFLIPALTMKSITDEKRNGTIELLLTKPIRISELILGKFLSTMILIVISLVLTLPYYLTIAFLGNIDHGVTILGYIDLLAISACYISIGIFASSLSHSPFTAFFISIGIGLCLQWLFNMMSEQLGSGFFAGLFGFLSINEHSDSLVKGVLDSRDIIYFVSIVAVFLSLARVFIQKDKS